MLLIGSNGTTGITGKIGVYGEGTSVSGIVALGTIKVSFLPGIRPIFPTSTPFIPNPVSKPRPNATPNKAATKPINPHKTQHTGTQRVFLLTGSSYGPKFLYNYDVLL